MEESEEDQDAALHGLMTVLISVLDNLPEQSNDHIKTSTGGDVIGSAAGEMQGGGKGGRGLVRELVEQCLFSVPQQRGNPREDVDEDEVGMIRNYVYADGIHYSPPCVLKMVVLYVCIYSAAS